MSQELLINFVWVQMTNFKKSFLSACTLNQWNSKKCLPRPIYLSWPCGFKTSWRLQEVLQKRLQDIFQMSCQDVFKTPSKRLQDLLQKLVQDIFEASCKDIFKAFSRRAIRLGCLPTMARGVFGAGSGFRVEWHTAVAVYFLSFGGFLLVLRGFYFGGGAGRWAILPWGLDTFLMFPNSQGS